MNIVHLGICKKYTCEHVLKERGKKTSKQTCAQKRQGGKAAEMEDEADWHRLRQQADPQTDM